MPLIAARYQPHNLSGEHLEIEVVKQRFAILNQADVIHAQ